MALWLMQHGEAADASADPERPLTPRGRADVSAVAAQLVRLGVWPDLIQHSDKVRARETAEIVAAALGVGAEETAGLRPDDDALPWVARLQVEDRQLMLVGHLPFLSRLASRLICGDPDSEVVQFAPGSVVRLECNDNCRVAWMLTPAMAAAMGTLTDSNRS
jgi:phosphohistidine phosphatase